MEELIVSIKIYTDSASDLPLNIVKENDIGLVCLTVNIKGEFLEDDLGQTIKYDDFYKSLREGELTSTAQVNVFTFEEAFKKELEKGNDIIYISLASELSGTYNSARIARENLLESYKDRRIEVIDSKGVTLGQGLLVYYANELKKSGKNIDEIVKWIVDNRTKVEYAIILDDLQHLKRGGRISGTTAAIGGLLGVKPTLKVTKEGRVVPGVKLKGRKKAINYLLNEIEEKAVNLEEQIVFIAHSDCEEDANALREKVIERYKFKDVILNNIGPVIGTHAGPDALAVIFIGNERE